jgi:hypothetical protein
MMATMNPRRLFNWLIVLTVAAGLLSVPFAAPAVAMTHHAVSGGETLVMPGDVHAVDDASGMHVMADGMPCCPDQGKGAKDCDSCPLLALCSMTMPVPAPMSASTLAPAPSAQTAFSLPDDLLIDGLGARPPDHPPRTLI